MTAHDTEGPAWSKALAEARVERDDLVGASRLLPFLAIYWLAAGAYDVAASFSEPNPQLPGNLAIRRWARAGRPVGHLVPRPFRQAQVRGLASGAAIVSLFGLVCALFSAVAAAAG